MCILLQVLSLFSKLCLLNSSSIYWQISIPNCVPMSFSPYRRQENFSQLL